MGFLMWQRLEKIWTITEGRECGILEGRERNTSGMRLSRVEETLIGTNQPGVRGIRGEETQLPGA